MADLFRRRFLDLLCSIYIYNEHRGYTAIDRMLKAIRSSWPDDHALIALVEKHRADEHKHYLMFRRWFERRGDMPFDLDRACGHIDRFVEIAFGSPIDDLDPLLIGRDDLFERLCRVISLTEKRGYRQVEVLLRNRTVLADSMLTKIFRVIEQDEPSHWAPYDGWLIDHGRRPANWRERAIDGFVHGELLALKLPVLFLSPALSRRTTWPDARDEAQGPEPARAAA
jgi:hypothetical protein